MSKTVVLFKGRAYSRGSRNDRVKPAHVPLGLLAIASPLIKEGYNVVVFDEKFDENIEKKMLSIKKDIIAVEKEISEKILQSIRLAENAEFPDPSEAYKGVYA